MSAKIFTISQQKGGAGKTTFTIHLGTYWSAIKNQRVALVDIDPQGSLSHWYRLRQERGIAENPNLLIRTISGWRTENEISRLQEEVDVILIDCPPHAETEARIAIRKASMVVIPAQASQVDLWATGPTVTLTTQEKAPVMVVLNRLAPRNKTLPKIADQFRKTGAVVADNSLKNRAVYAQCMALGRGVSERYPNSAAAQEVGALADEIWQRSQ